MSGQGDYPDEMRKPRPLDDGTIEAFFAGRPLPDEDVLLGSFAGSVRAFSVHSVPVPKGELAGVLLEGLTTDKGDLLVTTGSKVTGSRPEAAALPKWRRPQVTVSGLLSALLTKLGALGLAAKTGLVMAMAAASVTAAGAAGSLPAPVQNVVGRAVNDVTPFSFPTQANSHAQFGGRTSTTARTNHGVDGTTQSSLAQNQGSTQKANKPATGTDNSTGTGNSTSPPVNPGSQSSAGLNQANTTPAAGHAPTSVPTPTNPGDQSSAPSSGAPTNPGSQSSAGLNQANTTPAAGHARTSSPSLFRSR